MIILSGPVFISPPVSLGQQLFLMNINRCTLYELTLTVNSECQTQCTATSQSPKIGMASSWSVSLFNILEVHQVVNFRTYEYS